MAAANGEGGFGVVDETVEEVEVGKVKEKGRKEGVEELGEGREEREEGRGRQVELEAWEELRWEVDEDGDEDEVDRVEIGEVFGE